jgi:tRNA pseudouridine38-40 synthase
VKYKLFTAYDGTHYSGWQVQQNSTSIQMLIQNALSTALRKPTGVTGSGRTDSGVHALEQCAHFTFDGMLDLYKLRHSLNGLLPLDIRINSIEKASQDFHARYSAKSKIYRYHIHVAKVINPFKRLYSLHIPYPIDLDLLKKASILFLGEHDFTSFSNEAHQGSAARGAVRILNRLDLLHEDDEVILEFEANGFLYKMVRNIIGTLLNVAKGKLDLDVIPEIFAAKDRRKAPATAPAHGLFLVKVLYS